MFSRITIKQITSVWSNAYFFVCTFGIILSSSVSFAQDNVYKTDNTIIEAKVQEAGNIAVKGNTDLIVPIIDADIKCIIDKVDKTTIYYHIQKRGADTRGTIPVAQVIRYFHKQQWYDAIVPSYSNVKARNLILTENINEAIASYAQLILADSTNATLLAENAYVLALGGIYEAALLRLDRSWSMGTNSTDVNYFTGQVFALMGYDDITGEIWKPSEKYKPPSWIASKAPVFLEKYKTKAPIRSVKTRDELIARFNLANELASKNAYFQSIALFHEIVDFYPNEYIPYIGYGMTLERTGALQRSSQTIEKAISLIGDNAENIQQKQILEQHLISLRQKMTLLPVSSLPGLYQTKVADVLTRPQFMAYAGGTASPSLISINLRVGYYIVGSGNASLDFGWMKSDSISFSNLGLAVYNRSHNFVYGTGLQMTTGDGSTTFYLKLSAGYSIMNRDRTSSLDIFLDVNTTLSEGSPTIFGLSLGKSMYFGKRK
jgi:tetratricopeptide (TPR) repeat protein